MLALNRTAVDVGSRMKLGLDGVPHFPRQPRAHGASCASNADWTEGSYDAGAGLFRIPAVAFLVLSGISSRMPGAERRSASGIPLPHPLRHDTAWNLTRRLHCPALRLHSSLRCHQPGWYVCLLVLQPRQTANSTSAGSADRRCAAAAANNTWSWQAAQVISNSGHDEMIVRVFLRIPLVQSPCARRQLTCRETEA